MDSNLDLQLIKSVSIDVKGSPNITFATEGVSLSGDVVRPNSLFVPLELDEDKNRRLLMDALEKGAIGALWSKKERLPDEMDEAFPIFFVDDTFGALKKLAKSYFDEVDPTVVAISGCEGSGFTKNLTAHLLQKNYFVFKSTKENMSVKDLCALILNMDRTTTLLVSEYSVDEAAEMAHFLQPQFATFTDITPHIFPDERSREEILSKFIQMEKRMRVTANLLIDGDDEKLKEHQWNTDVATCGYGHDNLFQIEQLETIEDQITFRVKGVHQPFTIAGNDDKYVKYALFSIALSIQLGLFADEIEDRLKEYFRK